MLQCESNIICAFPSLSKHLMNPELWHGNHLYSSQSIPYCLGFTAVQPVCWNSVMIVITKWLTSIDNRWTDFNEVHEPRHRLDITTRANDLCVNKCFRWYVYLQSVRQRQVLQWTWRIIDNRTWNKYDSTHGWFCENLMCELDIREIAGEKSGPLLIWPLRTNSNCVWRDTS